MVYKRLQLEKLLSGYVVADYLATTLRWLCEHMHVARK
jgi:hypothetical protein